MKNTFFGIVIIILTIIAATQRGCLGPSSEHKGPDTVRVVDTVWNNHTNTIVKTVPVVKEIPGDIRYLPQPPVDYESLKAEYASLRAAHYSKKIYQDSVAVGKFGYIHLTDTVSQNALGKRKLREDFKIPTVKETVTITKYPDPKRQVYVGGGISGNKIELVNQAHVGVLLKNKKDQIFGVQVNFSPNTGVSYGVSSYWKLKLK